MSVIGDLDDFESTARGRQAMRQLAETYISSQPAKKASKRTVSNAVLTAKKTSKNTRVTMEQSNLMCVVTRPLSPDTRIEVSATWAEYEYAQEHLDNEGTKFPRLWYDSTQKIATVVAAPTPLHSDMVGELMGHLLTACNNAMVRGGISETIRDGLTQSSDTTNCTDGDDGLTIREWDVGVSQTYKSLRAAISWCVCALGCRLGIAMHISEGERGERPKRSRDVLRLQSRLHPFGPLVWNGVTWFGTLQKVVIETFRNENADCPPETLLEPTQSDGRFSEQDVPPNLKDIILGDCVPRHILSGSEILATPVDFFRQTWFESNIRTATLETAVLRIRRKTKVAQAH
ncbi:hypothetical protein V1522DRAFT_460592 [Lipomyces starkeyi]